MRTSSFHIVVLVTTVLLAGREADALEVTVGAAKDNTLYESSTGTISNGAGQHFFAGRTGQLSNSLRRGLLQFDIAGAIPAGATIQSVELTLSMSKTPLGAGASTISLHPVNTDWGEGASNDLGNEGSGTAAQAGDATWVHTFFNTGTWSLSGGDFSATASASLAVNAVGFYTWGSTSAMVADVQTWLDAPASNHGWLLQGDESAASTAKRFDTREILTASLRPALRIVYDVPCDCPNQADYDGDGFLTALDLGNMIDVLFAGKPDIQDPACSTSREDVDCDGFATALDLGKLIDHLFAGGDPPCNPCSP